MEFTNEEKQRLAEEIASWDDISNWVIVPKSLLLHVLDVEGKNEAIYKAVAALVNNANQTSLGASTMPSSLTDVITALAEAKKHRNEKGLLLMYFQEHREELIRKGYSGYIVDFLKQLKEKVPEQDIVSTIARLIEDNDAFNVVKL